MQEKEVFFQTVFHLNTTSLDCKDVYLMKWKPRRAAAERAKNDASFWLGLSLQSNWNQYLVSVNSWKKQLTSMSSQLEPAIWSRDTGQRIPCFDRCQLTITWMSSKSDVRYQRCPQNVQLDNILWCPAVMVSLSMAVIRELKQRDDDAEDDA